MRYLWAVLALLWCGASFATATNVYECSGSDGVYGREELTTNFRTGAGLPAWTVRAVIDIDSLTPGQDGVIWATHRASNDAQGHAVVFNDSGNNLEYQYNATAQFSTGAISANTDYGVSISYAGNGGNITIRMAAVASPGTISSQSGASGGSAFDDGQAQEVMFCGYESGGTVFMELDGQVGLFEILKDVSESDATFTAWLTDPLNVGDVDMTQNGTNAYWWDDTGTDQGGNGLGALTLATMALGSGNGPDIPEREAPPEPEESLSIFRRRH
jgi:hypothetical protein